MECYIRIALVRQVEMEGRQKYTYEINSVFNKVKKKFLIKNKTKCKNNTVNTKLRIQWTSFLNNGEIKTFSVQGQLKT